MRDFIRWRVRNALALFSRLLPEPRGAEINRILCMVSGGVGDRLMSLPALRFLRCEYPEAHLCVAWMEGELELVDGEFDRVAVFQSGDVWKPLVLAREGWDLIFVNTVGVYRALSEACAFVSKAGRRVGPVAVRDQTARSVYNNSYVFDERSHDTVLNAKAVGWEGLGPEIPYPVALSNRPDQGVVPPQRENIVGLHVGCRKGYDEKRWPVVRFQEAIRDLESAGVVGFRLLGDESEKELMEEVAQASGKAAVRVLSRSSQFFREVSQCSVLVGNDSGLCHIAAAVGTPVVVIMGPTEPERVGPVFDRGAVLQRHSDLPEGAKTVASVEVEDVVAAVRRELT